jgi:hypothetical protein
MTVAIRPITREQWLENAVLALRPLFDEHDVELPQVRVSVGWPSSRATSTSNRTIGECWKRGAASDGVSQIFISPTLHDAVDVLGVLIHELIHAWDNGASGHKGNVKKREGFRWLATAVGLEGKMTATTIGYDLGNKLVPMSDALGQYPHSALRVAGNVKTQSTRMLKLECPSDGYIVRTTQKWLDVGVPTCPCGTEMEVAA